MNKLVTRREALVGAAVVLGQSSSVAQTPLQITGRPVEITLTSIGKQTVRLMIRAIENGKPVPMIPDGALVNEDQGQQVAQITALTAPRSVKCGDLIVKLSASPLTIRVESSDNRLVQELQIDADTGKLSFQTGDSPLLGLGQGGPQYDRRGNADRMGSGQAAYKLGTHGSRLPVQFMVGTSGWAMFIHQPLGSFDLTGNSGVLHAASPQAALPLDVFVIAQKEPAAIMNEYARITGYPEMAPLWSFGYQQSHRTLGPPEEIMQEAKTFREKKLPCDAMIYLGTDFCPNGWNTHNGEFTWNEKAFPNPRQAVQELHDEHFKVVLHVVIEGHRFQGRVTDKCTAPPLPTGRTADGHWPPDRQVSCYWPAHEPLADVGVDGWWPDQGDGLDAPSRLARNQMYFEGQQMSRPNQRVYALHRNGYAGMQRFASFLWSGDILSSWETLKTHVPVAVNTGLSGIPYWGTDIGGFIPTQDFTGELFVRWFQFAAFNPLFRSHGREWRLRLPWGWNTGEIGTFRETPRYNPDPAELHNPKVEPICKKYLELRYRLMPYLYSAVKETCETGLPIIRSMWLHYPGDPAAVARGDQYLYGRDILVAPIVEKGATSRSLYLPHGLWYDFWTNEKMRGGREITRSVDLETIPLYVRAGAVVPMGPLKQYTAEKVDGPLTLLVHPGSDGAFSLYEDDGNTFDFRRGEFTRINIAWDERRRRIHMRLASGSKILGAMKRDVVVQIAGTSVRREAVFDGRHIEIRCS